MGNAVKRVVFECGCGVTIYEFAGGDILSVRPCASHLRHPGVQEASVKLVEAIRAVAEESENDDTN